MVFQYAAKAHLTAQVPQPQPLVALLAQPPPAYLAQPEWVPPAWTPQIQVAVLPFSSGTGATFSLSQGPSSFQACYSCGVRRMTQLSVGGGVPSLDEILL